MRDIEAELVRQGITKKQLAQAIGIGYNTLLMKLRGDTAFTLDEAFAIKRHIKSEQSIEELFSPTT